jgi:phosphatidylglycerol:prolipoprotein diacylglycerol transferase
VRPALFEFEIFGWQLAPPTYGLILAAAFVAALWVALRQARRAGVESSSITDLWIACLLSGVLGAKLLLYVLDWHYYLSNPWAILTSLRSAGVFYGGLLAAIVVCLVIVRRRGLDAWLIADILAPAIAIGQAVGRWGCFAAGCCYGKATTVPWAVTFTDPRAERYTGVPLGTPLHPTQLYLSAANIVLFLILIGTAARKRFDGQVFLLYLIFYPIIRGSLEFFRGDPRGEVLGLSTSQAIGIPALALGLILYVMRSRAEK